jgi:iron(III) transport system ATP-binding protein
MVEIRSLSLRYEGAAAPSVIDFSLRVDAGEFVTLLGPSGCGKTSTLRCVAGLETPSGGSITIGDSAVFDSTRAVEVPTHRRNIAMVFQSYAVWPHMTVRDNVAFPLKVAGLERSTIERRVGEVLERVGLSDYARRSATLLSGGQQQRVAIARALIRESAVMLLDEPLSNLDAKLREQMRVELRHLIKSVGITALYVTHDQEEALMLSDRIAVMQGGRLIELGSPRRLYLSPRTHFCATFLGAAETLPIRSWEGSHALTTLGPLQTASADRTGQYLAIRPEAIRLVAPDAAPGTNRFSVRIKTISFTGRMVQLGVQSEDGHVLQMLADPAVQFSLGDTIMIELPADRLMVVSEH